MSFFDVVQDAALVILSAAANKAKNITDKFNLPKPVFNDKTSRPFLLITKEEDMPLARITDKGEIKRLTLTLDPIVEYFSPLSKAHRRLEQVAPERSRFLVKDTKVYVVINNFHQVIGCHSRFRDGNPRKPIYFFFLSKHDAIDHLYHVGYSTKLLKRGLGIASFSLNEYFELVEKNKDKADLILLNDLMEVEKYIRKTKISSPKFKFTVAPHYHWLPALAKTTLVYRIISLAEEPIFLQLWFLSVDDAVKYWEKFIKDHPYYKKKRLTIELSGKTASELKEVAAAGLIF